MKKKNIFTILSLLIVLSLCFSFLFFYNKQINKEEDIKEDNIEEITEDNKIDLVQANLNFDNAINKIAKDNELIGISIVIFEEENIIHTYNYGYADKENNILVNDNTKYRIASISKLISTMGLMKLYDEGLFDLNDSIKEITNIDFHEDTTFKDLLTHRAGIDDDSSAYLQALHGSKHNIDYVIRNSQHYESNNKEYKYSNLGISSLGAIIEKLTDKHFGIYMHDFFNDLDIDAAYQRDLIKDKDNISNVYDDAGNIYRIKDWFRTSDYYNAYGLYNSYLQADCELIISAKDLAKLAMILANNGELNNKQILKEETIKLMLEEYVDVYSEENEYLYTEGLSCHKFKKLLDNRIIYGHIGSALGCSNALWFDPISHTGIVILDNYVPKEKENNINIILNQILNEYNNNYFD